MQFETKVVAVYSSNKALLALLNMVLSERNELRVRSFDTETALIEYMQAAPVHLLIVDDNAADYDPAELLKQLRQDETERFPSFQVIRLSRNVTAGMKAHCAAIGVDEVIAKPMSPKYLEDRVLTRLSQKPSRLLDRANFALERRRQPRPRSVPSDRFARPKSNVVPLFGV